MKHRHGILTGVFLTVSVFRGSSSATFGSFLPPEDFSRDCVQGPLARQVLGLAPAELTPPHLLDGPHAGGGGGGGVCWCLLLNKIPTETGSCSFITILVDPQPLVVPAAVQLLVLSGHGEVFW